MTTKLKSIGASSTIDPKSWNEFPWSKIKKQVLRLQMRIAKAIREGKKGRAKALQRILTCSFYAKCSAVRRVTRNKGANTPGIDGTLWRTSLQKIRAVRLLKRRGYKPMPLKRIYIPKKQKGKFRPISIPSIFDRAMQALWHLALEPIAEESADSNAYGFRPKRSTQDAREQCFIVLSKETSAKFIFEGDICSCFDKICHKWLLKNIPMDKQILSKFLKAGFMEKKMLYPIKLGVPQGSIIAPTISLMALSGLEKKLKCLFKKRGNKVNIVSYADDFIVTGASKELLRESVVPVIEAFLREIGLEISKEKSRITDIEKGFDFLGFNVRKYNRKLLIKPAKGSIKIFLTEIRKTIKANYSAKTENLINLLNPKINGWVNYYRHAVSSRIFTYVDHQIYKALSSWMFRRHPNKSKSWIINNYFRRDRLRNRFYVMIKDKDGKNIPFYLRMAKDTSIRRHIKIRGIAHPYNPEFKEYFEQRRTMLKTRKPKGITGIKIADELLSGN